MDVRVLELALVDADLPRADQPPEGEEEDASPISDGSDLDEGYNRRTPGARSDVVIAD